MKLVIAEKPSVGKAIAKVIGATTNGKGYTEGNGYIVTWCFGHLVGQSDPEDYDENLKQWAFDTLPIIPDIWHMKVSADTRSQFLLIKKLMFDERVTEIVCATDAGREGECIFRYVYKLARCNKPVLRLWVSSNEDKAIREGMANLHDDSEYDNLYNAGLCRSKADWLIGMNLTRMFSVRYSHLLKIGRVKTPTLRLIVDRDYEIEHFVKQKYFTVQLDCGSFKAESERIDDEAAANRVEWDCTGKTAVVTEVTKQVKTSNPPKLFSLSALQSAASKRFGYTAKRVLEIAQSLYDSDKRLTTYPRTNSEYLTDEQEESTLEIISTVLQTFPNMNSGMEYTPNVKRCINAKKVEDHHAILPTAEIAKYDISSLKDDERNVLFLICERLLLATAPEHKYEETKVTLTCEGHDFKASGKVVIEDGYKALERFLKKKKDPKSQDEMILPQIAEGDSFENENVQKIEHWTTPPKPYTDGTLIDKMKSVGKTGIIDDEKKEEIRGIGTEATRADIIEELIQIGLVKREKSYLVSSDKGRKLISVVPEDVKSPQMTADWESVFYDIERGKASDTEFLGKIENYVREIVGKYSELDTSINFNVPIGICPRCGKNVFERSKYYACESSCGFGLNKNMLGVNIPSEQVEKLLKDGKSDLIKNFSGKKGKFDAYLTIEEKEDKKTVAFSFDQPAVIGTCPRCGKNVLDHGKFYACESGKENCGFGMNKKISGKTISPTQFKKLLETGKTDLIKGFKSKSGNTFDAHLAIGDKDGKKSVGFEFEKKASEPVVIGTCPRCGKNVVEQRYSYSCESGKDGCGFTLWKEDKQRQINVKPDDARKLLSGESVRLNAVSKANKKYYADFKIEDTGEYVNLVYIPQDGQQAAASIGNCPKCGSEIHKWQNGYYCSGKCGMNIGKIYGRELTEQQLKKLLSGQKITLSINGRKTVVTSDYAENEYKGKIYYNWNTEK